MAPQHKPEPLRAVRSNSAGLRWRVRLAEVWGRTPEVGRAGRLQGLAAERCLKRRGSASSFAVVAGYTAGRTQVQDWASLGRSIRELCDSGLNPSRGPA